IFVVLGQIAGEHIDLRIDSASRSGGTETHISEAPTSMPPALWLITGMSSIAGCFTRFTRTPFLLFRALPHTITPALNWLRAGGDIEKSPERGSASPMNLSPSTGTTLFIGHPAPSYLRSWLPEALLSFCPNSASVASSSS